MLLQRRGHLVPSLLLVTAAGFQKSVPGIVDGPGRLALRLRLRSLTPEDIQRVFRIHEAKVIPARISQLCQHPFRERSEGIEIDIGHEGDDVLVVHVPDADPREPPASFERQDVEVRDAGTEEARQVRDGAWIDAFS